MCICLTSDSIESGNSDGFAFDRSNGSGSGFTGMTDFLAVKMQRFLLWRLRSMISGFFGVSSTKGTVTYSAQSHQSSDPRPSSGTVSLGTALHKP